MEEFDAIVVGGGLAGLGVSTSLAEKYGKKVVVLDKCKPEFNGNDRFKPNTSASFKNAGMCNIGGVGQGIKAYFDNETARRYKKIGVDIREGGSYVLAASQIGALAADLVLERLKKEEWEKAEPNVKLATAKTTALKFATGSQAEPEATMKVVVDYANGLEGIDLRYGEEVVNIERKEDSWLVSTKETILKAPKLVLAAGHGTPPLMKKIGLKLRMDNVYGLIAQSDELDLPQTWLKGSILGAKSFFFFYMQQFLCFCGNTLEATSWFGESGSWTTHLYINYHNKRVYLGGPRIALPEGKYKESDLTPEKYFYKIQEAQHYAEELIQFPPGARFTEENAWGGFMAFPKDRDMPLVGQVEGALDGSLYLSTGYASCGFREAFGAGEYCAGVMETGAQEYTNSLNSDDLYDWYEAVPKLGRRVKKM